MTYPCGSLPREFRSAHALCGADESESILAAFSGGSDSSAMLDMLAKYCAQTGTALYAAHVNHCIRGAEADKDEEFCRETAKRLGVKIFVLKVDVPAYAQKHKLSVETAARELRYEFFDRIMRENNIRILATAHNANDNLETILFNLSRGCGLSGICGIPPVRNCEGGYVVRPILEMSKTQILEYCHANGIEFVTDSTNTDTDYTRNMIRAQIIPALMAINSGAVENAARLSATLRDDAACLESMTDWFLESIEDDMSVDTEKLVGSPAAISSRVIIALYREVSGGKSLEQVHVNDIIRLCERCVPHSKIQLPSGIDAKIENKRLYFEKRCELPSAPEDFCVTLTDGKNSIPQINAEIITKGSQDENISENSISLYFNSAKICGSLVARNRQSSDKIKVNGVNKSIKKLLCDKKIPLEIRYRLPVICDDEGVIAVPFLAVADRARTKNGDLELKFILND